MWICKKCNKENEDSFDNCYSCGVSFAEGFSKQKRYERFTKKQKDEFIQNEEYKRRNEQDKRRTARKNSYIDYLIVIIVSSVYTFVVSSNTRGDLEDFFVDFLALLLFCALLAGFVSIHPTKKFSKVFVWTTIIVGILSGWGQLRLQ